MSMAITVTLTIQLYLIAISGTAFALISQAKATEKFRVRKDQIYR